MKDLLETKKQNEQFRNLFRLPPEEGLESKFLASLCFTKVFVLGKIYLSTNYACFHSLMPEEKEEMKLHNNGGNIVSGSSVETSRIKGVRDSGVLADSVLRGRRGSFYSNSGPPAFLNLVIPFVEIVEIGLEDDGPGYLMAVNTTWNKVLFILFTRALTPKWNANEKSSLSVYLLNQRCRALQPHPRIQERGLFTSPVCTFSSCGQRLSYQNKKWGAPLLRFCSLFSSSNFLQEKFQHGRTQESQNKQIGRILFTYESSLVRFLSP